MAENERMGAAQRNSKCRINGNNSVGNYRQAENYKERRRSRAQKDKEREMIEIKEKEQRKKTGFYCHIREKDESKIRKRENIRHAVQCKKRKHKEKKDD